MIIFHATDDDGERTSKSTVIEVRNQPPVAKISSDLSTIYVGDYVTFSGNGTTDSTQDKDGLVYLWDSDINSDSDGDGNTANDLDYNGMIFKTTYLTPGRYTVSLIVEDENECETSMCQVELEINVKSRPGGIFGQYVEDSGMSWFTVGLILILTISTMVLIAIRRRRGGLSGEENWDSETLGAAMKSSVPLGPPPDTAFETQNIEENENIEQIPIPETGIPEGWTIEQWNYYGKSWLANQSDEKSQNIDSNSPYDELDM